MTDDTQKEEGGLQKGQICLVDGIEEEEEEDVAVNDDDPVEEEEEDEDEKEKEAARESFDWAKSCPAAE